MRVVAAWGVEWGALPDEVTAVLKVPHLLVELPALQAVTDAGELFVLSFDFCNDGVSIGFELGSLLVVAVVAFDFGGGGEVQRMDHCSQGKEGSPVGL